MDKPVVLDIFCGAGGMSEGFIQAGFDVPFASDINENAKLTYTNRHQQLGYKIKFACEDIREFSKKQFLDDFLEGKEIDIVCGGPPCQGFSLAGRRDRNDPRNMLFKHYIETIENVKPKYFVMENVEGILSLKFDEFLGLTGRTYIDESVPNILKSEFLEFGYEVRWKILQANDFGVPQNRRRVFFIGHKIGKKDDGTYVNLVKPPNFPERNIALDISASEAIDDLSFLEAGQSSNKYYESSYLSEYQIQSINGRTPNMNGITIKSELLHNHHAARHSKKVIERFALMEEGESLDELRDRLSAAEWEIYKTKKLRCKRIQSNQCSPTVLTLPDDLVHYKKNRIMTVREFARLQSFDDSFEFLGKRTTGGDKRRFELPQYTQVGNAVPPLMAKAVAEEIMKALKATADMLFN